MYKIHNCNGFIGVAATPEAAVREAKDSIFISDARAKEILEALQAGASSQTATYGFAQTTITLS
jgi:hypothetical protein